jgi:hypothetical protein
MSDTLPHRVEIGDAVLYQELQDEVVLLNMTNQRYYGLNDVGAHMWKSLLESGDTAAAAESLRGSYAVEESVIRADLDGFVRSLLAAGLLKSV